MPLSIVKDLYGEPNPVTVPGDAKMRFKVCSMNGGVGVSVTYEIEAAYDVWFRRGKSREKKFTVDLETVGAQPQEVSQDVSFERGTGPDPGHFFRVFAHVSEKGEPPLDTDAHMVIKP
jgi:hypothetical protein